MIRLFQKFYGKSYVLYTVKGGGKDVRKGKNFSVQYKLNTGAGIFRIILNGLEVVVGADFLIIGNEIVERKRQGNSGGFFRLKRI